MFFHNYSVYVKETDKFVDTCHCGARVELDADYVQGSPMAATEQAQRLMAERCTCPIYELD